MMACRGDTTAMMCRDVSLVDDASTVYGNVTSDGETTINTSSVVNNEPFTNVNSEPGVETDTDTDGEGGGPGSIRHEHDLVNLVDMDSVDGNTNGSSQYSSSSNNKNNTNNQPESASEHSRLLTDDDDVSPETMWAQHRHMMKMKQEQQQQKQDSHYEHLDPKHDRSLQPASSWSKTLDGFAVGSNSNLKNNYNSFSGHESVSDRFYPNFDGGPHHDHHIANQNGPNGNAESYAFEMFGDSQNICRSAGDAISHAVTNVFKLDGQRDTTALFGTNNEGGDVFGAITGFIGNVNDQVDAVLIRVFNEQKTETVQIDPNYSAYSGLDDSAMTGDTSFDLNELNPLPSQGDDDRLHHLHQLRAHQRSREVDVATPIAGFSPQDAATVINSSLEQQQKNIQENVASSNDGVVNDNASDPKKTVSKVAKQTSSATADVAEHSINEKDEISTTDLISASYDDDDGSVQRFKEQLYRSLGINIPDENKVMPRPVPEVSKKSNGKTTESRDDDGGRPVVSSIVKAFNKTASSAPISSSKGKAVAGADKSGKTPTGHSSGGEVWKSFSELHKKRVMQVVKKNRTSSIDREIETETTNKQSKGSTSSPSVIDLSYFDDSNVAEADSRDFVPLGKTGIVDFHSNKFVGRSEPRTGNNPENHPDDAARDVSPSGMPPREEFRAMMKRLPKTLDSPTDSPQLEAIDLTMY